VGPNLATGSVPPFSLSGSGPNSGPGSVSGSFKPLSAAAIAALADVNAQAKEENLTKRFFPVTKNKASNASSDSGLDIPRKQKTAYGQNPPQESHVGWLLGYET